MSLIGEQDLQEPDYIMTEDEKMNDEEFKKINSIKLKIEELKIIKNKIGIHFDSKYVDLHLSKKLSYCDNYRNSECYSDCHIIEKLLKKEVSIEEILRLTEFNNTWNDDYKKLLKEEKLIEAELKKLLEIKGNKLEVLKCEEKSNFTKY